MLTKTIVDRWSDNINEGPLKANLHTTLNLLRHFGPGWLMFRLGYALRKRAGVLRRTLPATSWDQQPLESFLSDDRLGDAERLALHRTEGCPSFLFDAVHRQSLQPLFAEWDADRPGPVPIADALSEGVFRFFEHAEINLGCPPNWHHHPITGDDFPQGRHWTEIGDFAAGDVKYVWEPSRFAWAYPLVRAYWRTGDEQYPRLFWELFEDWKAANPPGQGVNWKCGQEVAIRVMACCFAMYGFATSAETTPVRIASLTQLMAVSATRIEGNLSYALSQQNNHGLTEATGLWTIGLLFPELAASPRWVRLGRESIEKQTRDLIDDDGAFSQQSVNYQRVMLDACVWAIRLGELNGQPLSDACRERVSRAGEFLWQLQDEVTGQLPRYGQNDGALLLPLTNCDPADYRPVVQSTASLNHKRTSKPGPWDEAAFWMFGREALDAETEANPRSDWQGATGGYLVLRAESGHLMTRAPRYRHRPAHADALHVDVWWRGQNMALDAGTFSYNAAPPWNNPLAGTACHNTVMVNGRDQMDRAGRFLWLPWLNGQQTAQATSPGGELTYWEGTHDGYERLTVPVSHRRGILRIGREHWLVIDSLSSRSEHAYRLHWLLADAPYLLDENRNVLTLQTSVGDYQVRLNSSLPSELSLIRADDASPRGWFAPHYADRQPALSLALEASADNILFATLLGPGESELQIAPDAINIVSGTWQCQVDLLFPVFESAVILRQAAFHGETSDSLVIGQ